MQLVGHIAEVTGLSSSVTEKEICDFFSCCGKIEHLEIFRYRDLICTAYVTFRGAYAVESAVLLSGATIGNQCVSISRLETSGDESIPEDDNLSKVEDISSSSESQADQFVSTPGEAITVAQEVFTSMIAKGHELSREALYKAKAFDESYQVSSTAAAKVAELSDKMGLTDKIHSSVEAVKSVDNKYHVSDITITVASATGRTAVSTANAVVNSRYFSMGALWVARLLERASKAAANLAKKGAEK